MRLSFIWKKSPFFPGDLKAGGLRGAIRKQNSLYFSLLTGKLAGDGFAMDCQHRQIVRLVETDPQAAVMKSRKINDFSAFFFSCRREFS
jgi:hypothetical protein